MANGNDLFEPLKNLTRKCVERDYFAYAEAFCNLLAALHTGRWSKLPHDEQVLWLERMANLLHARGLGDSWDWGDPDFASCRELVDALRKAHRKLPGELS